MSSITRRLSAALEGSIVVNTLQKIPDKSALIRRFRTEAFQPSKTEITTVWESSRFSTLIDIVMAWSQGSLFYQWLTDEPDPKVVTIDFRDTVIISPFISIFERSIQALSSSTSSSPLERNE